MANTDYGFIPSHPGLLLKDEIEYRGLSQRQLADDMQMSYTVINELLNGKRPLSPTTALMFEATLGVDADTLMRMQTRYNMQVARNDSSLLAKLKKMRKIAAL
ncbi:MAG: HigA family addiction module antidote protein [Prevotella sp.]|nr:HigA family addiction module antidote protein [Prevotella sp.]MCF0209336.1 HigA family addiction module antidote protein [Bacteroidaceae bacterium]